MFKTLTVIVPVYNEKNTIKECLNRILAADTIGLDLEIIVSDNNSTDGTKEILKTINNPKIKCFYREMNSGKGANIKNALKEANGDIILFQDADLEYSPKDFPDLLKPILNNDADVVFGSRFTRAKPIKIIGFPNYIGNKIFTFAFNLLFNTIFTDIATGYKVFKKNIIKNIKIKSDGFEIEPEITAKISKNKKLNIYEVPISISSRTLSEGKKVRWWDFFIYIYTMLKWRIFN